MLCVRVSIPREGGANVYIPQRQYVELAPAMPLFLQGDPGDYMYVLLSGEIAVRQLLDESAVTQARMADCGWLSPSRSTRLTN